MFKIRRFVKISNNYSNIKALIVLWPVYLVVFCVFFDTHAQMPILAPYTMSLGATPFTLGLVVGTYSLFNIIGNFIGGGAIDYKGWKYPLLFGLVGVSIALILYTLAGQADHLVAVRAAHGFTGGLMIPAALACLTVREKSGYTRDLRLAFFGATIGLASVSGPPAAGLIANQYGFHMVYYSLAGLMVVSAMLAFGLLKKWPTRPQCGNSPYRVTFKQITATPAIRGAFIFALGTTGSTGTLASFLPGRAESAGLDHGQTGMLFASFALAAIIIQLSWPGVIKKRIKESTFGCIAGLLLLIPALIMAGSFNSVAGLFIALVIYGCGFGLSFQGMLSMLLENSDRSWQGRAIGFFFAAYSLGIALLPPLGGLIWQLFPTVLPFYTAAAIVVLSLFTGLKTCRQISAFNL